MDLSQQLLFFFSALGVFNGIVLSTYFIAFSKQKKKSNYFLGSLLFMLSIRILKSVFFYFNPDLSKLFLQIGLSACFLIGPFLYFYLKSSLTPSTHKLQYKNHLAILFAIILFLGLIYPYESYPELWVNYFFKVIYYQWLGYLLLSGYLIKNLLMMLPNKRSDYSENEWWMVSIYVGSFLIWLAHFTASYTSYIAGALSFTFTFYVTILLLISLKKKVKRQKYTDKKINNSDAEMLLNKLDHLMISEELFKNPNLLMSDVAKKLIVLPQHLSQLVNDNLNKGFSVYINEYRIRHAKSLLNSENHMKMETISEESGFNSLSTFYSAFKKISGETPASYRSRL